MNSDEVFTTQISMTTIQSLTFPAEDTRLLTSVFGAMACMFTRPNRKTCVFYPYRGYDLGGLWLHRVSYRSQRILL